VKILYKLNFDSRALEIVEKLLDLNKKNATAWYLKTFYFIRNKDYSNSLKCPDESLNSNPNDEKIWEAI
jgi:tetratricopeptide (TPR) repeat protein